MPVFLKLMDRTRPFPALKVKSSFSMPHRTLNQFTLAFILPKIITFSKNPADTLSPKVMFQLMDILGREIEGEDFTLKK